MCSITPPSSLRKRTGEFLSFMIDHYVLEVVNKASDEDTEMKQLMAMATHIKCARLASLRNPSHIEAPSNPIDQ